MIEIAVQMLQLQHQLPKFTIKDREIIMKPNL